MGRQCHTVDQIISRCYEAEIELAKEHKIPKVFRSPGIGRFTYYRRRQKQYHGLRADRTRRLKAMRM